MDRRLLVAQLKGLGEPTRLDLVMRLSRREWGGTELLESARISQPNLSRHLKVLREAGLIQERKLGRSAYYRLKDNELAKVVVALARGLRLESLMAPRPTPRKHIDINMQNSESISLGRIDHRTADTDEDRGPVSPSIDEWLR